MATETVYTTGKSSTNARINIGSGAISTADGQIAFPDTCTSIKLVGAGSAADGTGTLLVIDSSGVIKKTGGTHTTVASIDGDISSQQSQIGGINYTIGQIQGSVGNTNGICPLDGSKLVPVINLPSATSTVLGATYASVQTSGTGGYSMAVGYQIPTVFTSGGSNTSNTLIGYNVAGASTTTTTSGNTAVGCQALNNYGNGSSNTAIGAFSGITCTTGTNNVFIGYAADMNAGTYSGSIALGANTFIKASNEFAIAPNVTQIRAEGLSTIAPKGYSKMMYDATNKVMRPMSGGDFWAAEVQTEYTQSLTSGTGAAVINSLIPIYGSTASWITGGATITIPSGFPNLGIWEVTVSAYVATTAATTTLSLDIIRGATTFARFENVISSSEWVSRGGTRLVQLTPGQTIVMQLNWSTSGATTAVIKPSSTFIHLKFLGVGTL